MGLKTWTIRCGLGSALALYALAPAGGSPAWAQPPSHRCAAAAVEQAQKLLVFHFGADDRMRCRQVGENAVADPQPGQPRAALRRPRSVGPHLQGRVPDALSLRADGRLRPDGSGNPRIRQPVVLSEGLRPSDSPTRSLARRGAGALRSRGSLAALARDVSWLESLGGQSRSILALSRLQMMRCFLRSACSSPDTHPNTFGSPSSFCTR